MAMKLFEWVQKEKTIRATMDKATLDYQYFYRDPPRPMLDNPEMFFAPADGIILYNRVIQDPLDPVLQVKGRYFSLRELLNDPGYSLPSLVVGTFMSSWNCHVNRMPTAGNLSFKELPLISTSNVPMLKTEKDILAGFLDVNLIKYVKNNQRVLNRIVSTALGIEYFVGQIADRDANVITPFAIQQNKWFAQCERFSAIRWGSQVDLIVPLGDFKYEFLQDEETVVEAGVDGLIKIIP